MVKYLIFLWMIITISYIINGTTGQPMDDQRNYCYKIYTRHMKNLERFLCIQTCIWMEEGVISRQGVLNLNSLKFKMKFNDLDARKLVNFEMCLRKSFENLMMKKCEDIAKVYSCYASITTLPSWNMYNKRIAGGVGQSLYNNVEGFSSRRGRKSYVTKNPNERFIFMISSSANKLVSKILDPIVETTAGILLSGSKMVFPKIVTDAIEGLASGFNSFIEGFEYGIKSSLDLITDGLEYSLKLVYTHVLYPFMEGFRASMEAKKNKQKNNSSFMRSFSSTSPGNKVVNPTMETAANRFINFKKHADKVTDSVKQVVESAGNVAGSIVGSIDNAANSLLSINNPVDEINVEKVTDLVKNVAGSLVDNNNKIVEINTKIVFPKIVTDAIEGLASGFNSFIEGIEYGIKSTLDLITDGLEYSLKLVYTHVLSPFMEGFRASMEAKKNKQKNNSSFMRSFSSTSPENKVVNPMMETAANRFINFKKHADKVTDSVKQVVESAGNVAGSIVGSIDNAANSLLSINNPVDEINVEKVTDLVKDVAGSLVDNNNKIAEINTVESNTENANENREGTEYHSVILAVDVADFFSKLHDVLPKLVDYIGPNLASATGEIAKEVTASIVPNVMHGINKLVNQIIEDVATNIAATAPSILKEAENLSTSTIMQLNYLITDIHKIITKNENVLSKNDE